MNLAFFSVAATLWAGSPLAWAQHQPGVYTSSQEYVENSPGQPGTVSYLADAPSYIEVVNASTYAVHRVPLTHAWGYANASGVVFRLVGSKQYRIEPQQNGLVVYSRQQAIQHSRYTHVVTEHFYSAGLDGPLRPLTRRSLRQQALTAN